MDETRWEPTAFQSSVVCLGICLAFCCYILSVKVNSSYDSSSSSSFFVCSLLRVARADHLPPSRPVLCIRFCQPTFTSSINLLCSLLSSLTVPTYKAFTLTSYPPLSLPSSSIVFTSTLLVNSSRKGVILYQNSTNLVWKSNFWWSLNLVCKNVPLNALFLMQTSQIIQAWEKKYWQLLVINSWRNIKKLKIIFKMLFRGCVGCQGFVFLVIIIFIQWIIIIQWKNK